MIAEHARARTIEALERRLAEVEQRLEAAEAHPRRRRRPRATAVHLLASSVLLAVLVAPLAIAGPGGGGEDARVAGNARGEAVQIGLRNRSDRETGLIASGDGYSLRLSNVRRGQGGGAIFGCRAGDPGEAGGGLGPGDESCVNADNLTDGLAFFFRSREGSSAGHFQVDGPNAVPFSTNARGLVSNLNAEMVGGLTAQQLIAQSRGSAPTDPVPGTQGPAGPEGPRGPEGPEGPQGPQGPAGSDAEFDGATAGGDLTGTYPNPELAFDSVGNPQIAPNAVGSLEIGNSTVGAADLNSAAFAADDLGFVTGKLAILTDAIESAAIQDGEVRTADLDDGAVTNAKLGSSSVNSATVDDGSLRRADDSIFDTVTFIDPPSIPAGGCETDTQSGSVFSNVEVGDVGYTYPLASLADGLMVQTGIRQSVAGSFQYRICNIGSAAVNDGSRVYGVRLVR